MNAIKEQQRNENEDPMSDNSGATIE